MAETPFGTMGGINPLAPTKKQVAENPGAYDGTVFDPTTQRCDNFTVRHFATSDLPGSIDSWDDFYRADPDGAMAYLTAQQEGTPLNLDGLTTAQKKRLGIGTAAVSLDALAKQQAVTQAMLSTVLSILTPAPKKR